MNETELQQFRQVLLEEKQSLLAMAEDTRATTQPVTLDQPSVGRLSRMDAMQAQQMAQETERRRVDRIARIEGALRRVEAGDFGYCYVCDDEIDLQRLKFDPTTTRCVSCKSDDGVS